MQYCDDLALGEMIKECVRLISLLGVDLQAGRDFEMFKFLVSDSDKENPLDPIFDPVFSDITERKGMWLIGRNRRGEIIQTQAVRSLDLEGETFAHFLDNHIADIRPYGFNIDIKNTSWRLSPNASKIAGNVFYHGGLWIDKEFRGSALATLVTRYLLARAVMELEPDYFVGLQSPYTSCKGLAAREGYMHLEQRSILWQLKDQSDTFEDWLVWMDREEAEFNLSIPPKNLFEMFAQSPAKAIFDQKTGTNG